MKRLLTYCLLAATLVLGAVALYATACEDAAVPTASGCNHTHSCPDHNTLAFDLPDQAGIPAGLNRAPHFRTPTSLTREETGWLNNYHRQVYEHLSPSLNNDERRWLAQATQPI